MRLKLPALKLLSGLSFTYQGIEVSASRALSSEPSVGPLLCAETEMRALQLIGNFELDRPP